ncbi:MAG: A/G-specific adenine glycosylase [Victivallaceae bacterium]|nr:A/G-specific adenine glycosylase [Victivallaceae bacterium]
MPEERVERILKWFAANARVLAWRQEPSPYRVWISEIMLQQTRVEAVKDYFARFTTRFPDVKSLAAASEEEVLKLWQGLGYYSRARNLHHAAKQIAEAGKFPDTPAGIARLPGIGAYTAGAIASIAFDIPEPAVDGNVLRVLARLLGFTLTREQAEAQLRSWMPSAGKRSAFTQSWMELGATVCLPNGAPQCEQCPLADFCVAKAQDRIAQLPAKEPKKARKIELKTAFLIVAHGKIALRRRPARGVLANLWEFPWAEGALTMQEAHAFLAGIGRGEVHLSQLPPRKHIFTHLQWEMRNYRVQADNWTGPDEFVWVTPEELHNAYMLPSAFSALLPHLAD